MVACQSGQRQAMFYLVEQGANVNAQNIYGAGPLHELIKNKRENLAVWLIKHGADIYMVWCLFDAAWFHTQFLIYFVYTGGQAHVFSVRFGFAVVSKGHEKDCR